MRELPPYHPSMDDPWSWFLPGFGRLVLSPFNPRVFGRPYLDEFRGPFNWADSESGYAGLVALAGSVVALQLPQLASPSSRRQPGACACKSRMREVTTLSRSALGCPSVATETERPARSIFTASRAGSRRMTSATVCTRHFGSFTFPAIFCAIGLNLT